MLKPSPTTLTQLETDARALALQGKTPRQIAEALDKSEMVVRRALARGRLKLGYETKEQRA